MSTEEKNDHDRPVAEGREKSCDRKLTMIDTKSEVGTASENGERKIYSEKQTQEELSYSSTSYKRAQHALHETEKVLSSAHCSSEQGKDGEGVKNADRIKSRSPLKMTRSMSLRKKNRPHPPPPKAEVMSSGVTEEYLCQISCIKALKESLEEILACIEVKEATICQLKQEAAIIKEAISQPVLITQSPVLRRNSNLTARRPQSCLELISEDSDSRVVGTNREVS